jgi:serine/threonine protein phosphatase PrpC
MEGFPVKIESNASTHVGRRSQNEDAHCVEDELGLFAVADGMGGQKGGEIASRTAIGSLVDFFRTAANDPMVTWPSGLDTALTFNEGMVEMAVRRANRAVIQRKRGPVAKMGSTLALMVIREDEAVIAHIGDSRVYRLRDGELKQLTTDHSLYQELRDQGIPNLPPRHLFPYSNVITRVLGMNDSRADLRTESLRQGDVYLLCTDGLIETVSEGRIAEVLSSMPPADAGPTLVDEAYLRGGRDNITAVVVRIDEGVARRGAKGVSRRGAEAQRASVR